MTVKATVMTASVVVAMAGGLLVDAVPAAAVQPASTQVGSVAGVPAGVYGFVGEIVYQDTAGDLTTRGPLGSRDWHLGLMAGTSPSITLLDGGGYEIAFQANTGYLWTAGTAGVRNWGLGMKTGTSPSIGGLVGGGEEIAFQANTGILWTAGTARLGPTGLSMMAGTSPSIAGLTGGSWAAAFQGSHGELWSVGATKNQRWGLGMKAGTSPAITALSANGYQMAFQANTGDLWTFGSQGLADTGKSMRAGTSPAITTIGDRYQMAFNSASGQLHSTGQLGTYSWGLGMADRTSPGISPSGTGVSVAFQANTGVLWTTGASSTMNSGEPVKSGTSPAIEGGLLFTRHAPPDFYAENYFHGLSVVFNPDHTGQSLLHVGATKSGEWIKERDVYSTQLSADRYSLSVHITGISWLAYDSANHAHHVPNPYPGSNGNRVGDAFTVSFIEPHLMIGSDFIQSAPTGVNGYLYLCQDGLAATFEHFCGA